MLHWQLYILNCFLCWASRVKPQAFCSRWMSSMLLTAAPLWILGHWITLGNDSHTQQDCTSRFRRCQEAHKFEKQLVGQAYGEKPVIKGCFQSQCLLQQEGAVKTRFGPLERFPWNSLSWSQDLKVWRTAVGRVVLSSCGLCNPAVKAKSLHPLCVRFYSSGVLETETERR